MSRLPMLLIAASSVLALSACDKMPFGQQTTAAPASAPANPSPPPAATASPPPAVAPAQPAGAPPAMAPPPSSASAPPSAASAPAPAPGAPMAAGATPSPGAEGPSLEARSNVKQGFAYIAAAKSAKTRANFEENIENAINEFSQAIRKEPRYADAYSDRAVAYMQQKKYNKAMEDLRKAVELAPQSPSIHYNLASLHSLQGNTDLALDEIDACLVRGFADYDALRKDPDLDNVRRHPEFRKILEKHKVFIVR